MTIWKDSRITNFIFRIIEWSVVSSGQESNGRYNKYSTNKIYSPVAALEYANSVAHLH